jgi:hypothetical protein
VRVAKKAQVTRQSKTTTTTDPAPKWTVMIFMGAGAIDGDASLTEFVDQDIQQIERALKREKSDGELNVFVEIHGLGRATRQHLGVDSEPSFVPEERTQAEAVVDGRPILAFIDWALKTARHRRTDYSLLIMWGHAYEFAFARQQTPSGIDAVDFGEFANALRKFQEQAQQDYPGEGPPRLDIVGFDACDVSTLELANQLQPFASYLIGSQIGVPLPGWPYYTILSRLRHPRYGRVMTPTDFGSFVVRRFCEEYSTPGDDGQPHPVSLTLLDLSRAPEAFDAAEKLAGAIARACGDDLDELDLVLAQFVAAQTIDGKPFVDVADFCLNLSRHSGDVEVRKLASELGDILIRPAFPFPRDNHRGALIVEHSRNAHQTAKLHGVSLYAPQILGEDFDWRTVRFWYNKFDFTGETLWGRLVHVLAEMQ